MSGIVDFLRARYTEAREREHSKRRSIPSPFDGHDVEIRYSIGESEQVFVNGHPYPPEKYFEIATEPAPDPDVLADLDAKLAVLDEHPAASGWDGHEVDGRVCGTCAEISHDGELTGDPYPCRTLRHLAVPFAAHPHYEERWRP